MENKKKIKFIIFSVLAVVVALVTSLGSFFWVKNARQINDIIYIAHRGYGNAENSESDFLNSTSFGGVECDVHFTKDNVAVINHDEVVVIDSGEKFTIKESEYSTLTNYKLFNQKICTLERYLTICAQLNTLAVIELKAEMVKEQIDLILTSIDSNYSRNNIIFISFNKENILLAKESGLPCFLLFSKRVKENVDFCITNNINADVKHTLLTKQMVERLRSNNLKVGAWTVNNKLALTKCVKLGVDYITSDVYSTFN